MTFSDPPKRSPRTQMRVQSVRFSEQTWQAIQADAHAQGISASQFIRESAIARVAWNMAQREDAVLWDSLMREIRRISGLPNGNGEEE